MTAKNDTEEASQSSKNGVASAVETTGNTLNGALNELSKGLESSGKRGADAGDLLRTIGDITGGVVKATGVLLVGLFTAGKQAVSSNPVDDSERRLCHPTSEVESAGKNYADRLQHQCRQSMQESSNQVTASNVLQEKEADPNHRTGQGR